MPLYMGEKNQETLIFNNPTKEFYEKVKSM